MYPGLCVGEVLSIFALREWMRQVMTKAPRHELSSLPLCIYNEYVNVPSMIIVQAPLSPALYSAIPSTIIQQRVPAIGTHC